MKRITALFFSMILTLVVAPWQLVADDDDAHFIQSDDYFISTEAFKPQYIRVELAKMKTPATPQTKNMAEFLNVMSGEETWTQYYWSTRIATKEEIKLGLLVIVFEVCGDNDVYRAPESKEEARTGPWFMAKVTDVSDMFRGFVTVSGGYKIALTNLRVIVTKK